MLRLSHEQVSVPRPRRETLFQWTAEKRGDLRSLQNRGLRWNTGLYIALEIRKGVLAPRIEAAVISSPRSVGSPGPDSLVAQRAPSNVPSEQSHWVNLGAVRVISETYRR